MYLNILICDNSQIAAFLVNQPISPKRLFPSAVLVGELLSELHVTKLCAIHGRWD